MIVSYLLDSACRSVLQKDKYNNTQSPASVNLIPEGWCLRGMSGNSVHFAQWYVVLLGKSYVPNLLKSTKALSGVSWLFSLCENSQLKNLSPHEVK